MRLIVLCLGLLLVAPAAATSVDESFCGPSSVPVARMAGSETLCRASVLSFSEVPAATQAEAVDLALMTLGVGLVTVHARDVTQALWMFANRALSARTHDELKQAAASLAWALSKVGVTVVAFVLTKKMVSKVARPREPPDAQPLVTPEGLVQRLEWRAPRMTVGSRNGCPASRRREHSPHAMRRAEGVSGSPRPGRPDAVAAAQELLGAVTGREEVGDLWVPSPVASPVPSPPGVLHLGSRRPGRLNDPRSEAPHGDFLADPSGSAPWLATQLEGRPRRALAGFPCPPDRGLSPAL